jgi:hypothetical protein
MPFPPKKIGLSEMARTLIKKIRFFFYLTTTSMTMLTMMMMMAVFFLGGGGFRVLACADTLARTPLGVRQYFSLSFYALLLFSDLDLT